MLFNFNAEKARYFQGRHLTCDEVRAEVRSVASINTIWVFPPVGRVLSFVSGLRTQESTLSTKTNLTLHSLAISYCASSCALRYSPSLSFRYMIRIIQSLGISFVVRIVGYNSLASWSIFDGIKCCLVWSHDQLFDCLT